MTVCRYDIVFIADVRFEGGTSTALAAEMAAAAREGWSTGLLMVKGPILGLPFPVHADIRCHLDNGLTDRVDPAQKVETRLLLLHHPGILINPLQPRPMIEAEKVVIVLHHPAIDRAGNRQYDIATVVKHARFAFGKPVLLAPVSAVVRKSLPRHLPQDCALLEEDWHNLIDLDDWPRRKPQALKMPVRIGRHSRPHPQKWPDTLEEAKAVYPTDARRYEIRMLGGEEFLHAHYGAIPENWKLQPFGFAGVADFLAGLDFYVYYHSEAWSEAFGRAILEALAVGLVVVLPKHFEPLFGEAALYAVPDDVKMLIDHHIANPALYAAQSERARRFAEERHSIARFAGRIAALMPANADIRPSPVSLMPPLPPRPVLFLSSNGVGMGHITRQMAVADRLPPDLIAVFATMSYAAKVAVDAGYQTHFFNHHRAMGAETQDWRSVFADELFELVSHLKPAVIAYDATAVFPAIADVLALFPDIYALWMRRPMWREGHRLFLDLESAFDAVIEPGEFAEEFDSGPTRDVRHRAHTVPPVLHITPQDRMERDEARRLLALPVDSTVVALQIGSGNNFDMTGVRAAVIDAVLSHPDTVVVEFQSPIRAATEPVRPSGPRHLVREAYPVFRYSRAFDAAVSAAGYNGFHENLLGAIPTLFVPNEADEMDMQLSRARWAELNGYGWTMRRDTDLPRCRDFITRLLDPWQRRHITARCEAIDWQNGADKIAAFITDHARLVRSDRKLADSL